MTNEENKNCSVCQRLLDREDAPVLTMGHYAYPRLLCTECEGLIETSLKSRDTAVAEEAMSRLGKTVSENSADDHAVLEAVEEIFKTAADRIEKIKDGTYDFALDDEESESVLEDIPEELLETEEDKKRTEREEEVNRKFNKVMDVITAVVFIAAAVILAIYFIKR